MHRTLKVFLATSSLVLSLAAVASPDGSGVGVTPKPKPPVVTPAPVVGTPAPVVAPAPTPVPATPILERLTKYGYSDTYCKIFADGRVVFSRSTSGLVTEETRQLKFINGSDATLAKLITAVTGAAFIDRHVGRMPITSYTRQLRADGAVIDQSWGAIWQATRNSPDTATLVHFIDSNCP